MVWVSHEQAHKAGLSVYQHLQRNLAAVIAATRASQDWKTNPVGLVYLPFHEHTAPFDDGPSKKVTDFQTWVQDALWTKTLSVPYQLIYKLMKIGIGLPRMLEAFAQRVEMNDVVALQIIGQNLAKHHLQPASKVLGQLMTYVKTIEEQEEVKNMMDWDFNALYDLFLYLVTQQYLPNELQDVVSGIRCLAHVLNGLDVADLHIEGPATSNADPMDGRSDAPIAKRILTTTLSGNRYRTYSPTTVPTAHSDDSEAVASEAETGLRFGQFIAAKSASFGTTQQASGTAGVPTSQAATSVFGNFSGQQQQPAGTATFITSAQQQANALGQDASSDSTTDSNTTGFGVNTHPTSTFFGTQPTNATPGTYGDAPSQTTGMNYNASAQSDVSGAENTSPGTNATPAQMGSLISGLTDACIGFGSNAQASTSPKAGTLYPQRIGSTLTTDPNSGGSGGGHGSLTPNLFNAGLNSNTKTRTPLPKLGGLFGVKNITPTSISGSVGGGSLYNGSNPTLIGGSGASGLFGSTGGKANVGFGRGM